MQVTLNLTVICREGGGTAAWGTKAGFLLPFDFGVVASLSSSDASCRVLLCSSTVLCKHRLLSVLFEIQYLCLGYNLINGGRALSTLFD
jgi:hypothetical protein